MQKHVGHLGEFYGKNVKATTLLVLFDRWSALQPCLAKPADPLLRKAKPPPSSNGSINFYSCLKQSAANSRRPIKSRHSKGTANIFNETQTRPCGRCNGPASVDPQLCASCSSSRMVLVWLDFQIRSGSSCTAASTRLKTEMPADRGPRSRISSVGNTKQDLLDLRFTFYCGAETKRKNLSQDHLMVRVGAASTTAGEQTHLCCKMERVQMKTVLWIFLNVLEYLGFYLMIF